MVLSNVNYANAMLFGQVQIFWEMLANITTETFLCCFRSLQSCCQQLEKTFHNYAVLMFSLNIKFVDFVSEGNLIIIMFSK